MSRLFRIFFILGSVLMILMIIIYWDNVGTTHLYLHTIISGPHSSRLCLEGHGDPQRKPDEDKGRSLLSDIDAFANQFLDGTADGVEQARGISMEMQHRQDSRKQLIHDMCSTNSSLYFREKNRTFDDIPINELDHLIVDDKHGIIYCYVPKVACTNWKRIMVMLSESLGVNGTPYQSPKDIPGTLVHKRNLHFTFNNFPKRYGKFSRQQMKIKLKNYTKFLFVRDPFVRLISAYRNKFEKADEYFYKYYGFVMMQRYTNYTKPPKSVMDAYAAGIRPSFFNFIQYLLDPKTEKETPFNEHWKQVYRLCHPCQINYDFVGKLETLDEDAEHLLRLLRVDNIVEFPHGYQNRTARSWEENWFTSIPYESRRELYKLYEADFRLFGYSKPKIPLHE